MKITVNLLPPEVAAQEIKRATFYKVQTIGVMMIMAVVFLTSVTVALRILQSHNIQAIQATLAVEEQKVSDLKSTQASLLVLKDRLEVLNQYFKISSKQTSNYNLIEKLIPASVVINGINIDKSGEIVFSALVPDSIDLDTLVSNLTNKETNEDRISQVSIESLNRGRDGNYRISFKLKSK